MSFYFTSFVLFPLAISYGFNSNNNSFIKHYNLQFRDLHTYVWGEVMDSSENEDDVPAYSLPPHSVVNI